MLACFVVINKGDGKCFKLEGQWLDIWGSGIIMEGSGMIMEGEWHEEESRVGMGCAHTHHIGLCIAPQVTQLQAYKDKRSELADAEQFVVVVSVVVV